MVRKLIALCLTLAMGGTVCAAGLVASSAVSVRVQTAPQAPAGEWTVFTQNSLVKVLTPDGQDLVRFIPTVWGPHWGWTGMRGAFEPQGAGAQAALTGNLGNSGVPLHYQLTVTPDGPRKFTINVTFGVERDTDLTLAVLAVHPGQTLLGPGRLVLHDTHGQVVKNLPLGQGPLTSSLQQVELHDGSGQTCTITMDRPTAATMGGDLRIALAQDHLAAGSVQHMAMTVELPAQARFYLTPQSVPMPADGSQWFPWKGTGQPSQGSVIDLSSWLDAPAGKFGRITRQGEELIYHGQPLKLWGINCCFAKCAPPHEQAQQDAAFYAHYGINAVRFHKFGCGFSWDGILSHTSFDQYDPTRLDNMDYFFQQLKQHGLYVELSANFGYPRVGPDDAAKVPFVSELPTSGPGWHNAPQGALWFSKSLQDLQIGQIITLLNHTNPYTHLRYADDPGLFNIEMVNENDIFFYTTLNALQRIPAIKERAGRAFFAWLKKKYGSEQALQVAWGPGTIGCFKNEQMADESWAKGVIYPVGNPWYFDSAQLDKQMKPRKQRLLDTMNFLYDQQNAFYDRYTAAIRATGYKGLLLQSNWQAGSGIAHFLNLASDARADLVDRHNYFSGTGSMLASPGGGMLSAGMDQVADRPFMLSEWIHCFPNEFGVEGPAILGAYGMGLNGWDVSFIFQNGDNGTFRKELREEWDVVTPQILGVFPAVARQVLRGDVKEAQTTFTRNVNVPSLLEGKLGFEDKVQQGYDVKEFGSKTIPAASLAVGRSVVALTPAFEPTATANLSPYIHDGLVRSVDGQLAWQAGRTPRDGYITIDTPGTQAVVGFADGKTIDLKDVVLTSHTPYAAIYVTALDRQGAIATDRHLLITTIARVRNTGMKMIQGNLIARGGPPLLVEPVTVDLTFKRSGTPTIYVLDQDGRRTGQTLKPVDGKVTLDGAHTHTIYYEVVYDGATP